MLCKLSIVKAGNVSYNNNTHVYQKIAEILGVCKQTILIGVGELVY